LDLLKWDKIELSDDEDFECHPNVDKSSMVRWKQAEIYRVRRERQDKIDLLNREIKFNEACLEDIKATDGDELGRVKNDYDVKSEKFKQDMVMFRYRQRDTRWKEPEPIEFCEQRTHAGKFRSVSNSKQANMLTRSSEK
jgi:cell division cycle protein 37